MPHNKNKRNKRKFLRDVKISKTPGRQIIVRGKPVSPIRAATAIKGDSLYSDPNYALRDSFEFDIDKNQIDREMGYENFAVNLFTFQSLEILYLKRAGHRRAIFEWLDNDLKKNWLIP